MSEHPFFDQDEIIPAQQQGPDLRVGGISQLRIADSRQYFYGLGNTNDAIIKSIRPGEFVLWGAREGHGKNSLVERFALHNGSEYKILLASLDMKPHVVQDRCLAKFLGVDLDGVEWARRDNTDSYQRAMESLTKLDFLVWQPKKKTDRDVHGITERAEDVSADVLIIDYSRMIYGWRPGVIAGDIVDYLVDWASTKRIATILLVQLQPVASGKRPHDGWIQDTSNLSQRADRINLLYRPYHGHPVRDTVVELLVTKNRRGKPCRPHLGWVGPTMDYYELSEEQESRLTCCRYR